MSRKTSTKSFKTTTPPKSTTSLRPQVCLNCVTVSERELERLVLDRTGVAKSQSNEKPSARQQPSTKPITPNG